MALKTSYPTEVAAVTDLEANGFHATSNRFWSKPSMTGGNLWSAPHSTHALCSIQHNHVDPAYNSPDYYTVKFHS
jgi:hypothetical protein